MAGERLISRYDFEGGGFVAIEAYQVDTLDALEMVETLIALKRDEIKKINTPRNQTRLEDEC